MLVLGHDALVLSVAPLVAAMDAGAMLVRVDQVREDGPRQGRRAGVVLGQADVATAQTLGAHDLTDGRFDQGAPLRKIVPCTSLTNNSSLVAGI